MGRVHGSIRFFITPNAQWYGSRKKRETVPGEKHTGYCSDIYTDQALAWLKARDAKKPFCMMLHFKAPHHSYEYPERWKDYLKRHTHTRSRPALHEDIEKTSPLAQGRAHLAHGP